MQIGTRSTRNTPLKSLFDKFTKGDTVDTVGTFGWAIEAMKVGEKCYREGWNGHGMWIMIQNPDEHSKMTKPYIFMNTAQNDQIPWLASQADMLEDDWRAL